MAERVHLQESKEFQAKVDVEKCLPKGRPARGSIDEAIFDAVADAIRAAVDSVRGTEKARLKLDKKSWHREGIRYDTDDGLFKANNLTLAIEATEKRTKLKCKGHNFVPELLYDKPSLAVAYPDIRKSSAYKKHDTTFKLEQDLHFDNIKYCASGSLYVKGCQTGDKDSSFFSRYFPGVETILPEVVPLRAISHWDETIFDDMDTRWGQYDIDSWMLVNRWDAKTKKLLEAEISFKIVKGMDEDWDRVGLREASRLYLALQKTGIFRDLPPIFTFSNPVSSIDIVEAPKTRKGQR